MYIQIKIEIASNQNKLKFGRALTRLAKETFFDSFTVLHLEVNWISTNSSLLNTFEIILITRGCLK